MKNNEILIIVVVIVVFIFLNSVSSGKQGSQVTTNSTWLPSSGGGSGGGGGGGEPAPSVDTVVLKVFGEEGQPLTFIDWGPLAPGTSNMVPVSFGSDSTVTWTSFSIIGSNYQPPEIQQFLNLTLVNGTIILDVASDAPTGSFSFDVTITGTYL